MFPEFGRDKRGFTLIRMGKQVAPSPLLREGRWPEVHQAVKSTSNTP